MAKRAKRKNGLLQKSFRVQVKGVSKQFVVYGRTEAELTKKEMAKREEIEKGIDKIENPTVTEYYERWVKGRVGTISEATLRTQGKMFGIASNIKITALFNTCFGDIKLKAVDITILRELQAELKTTRKTQTVNDYMALIKHIFSDALKERVIDYNPCVLLNNYKRTEEKARNTYHRALTLEEQNAFFNNDRCKNSYYYNVYCFAISTGMRTGEIGALKYSDIHNDIIHVERTITRTASGAYAVGEDAKTKSGKREIPMNDRIKHVVSEQKKLNHMIDNGVVSMNSRLFKAPEGGLLMATPIDREIKRICAEIGIEPFTMHALRDTFATRAIESGMNPKTLQEILGHSDFKITMNLYAHCMTDTKKNEMDALNIDFCGCGSTNGSTEPIILCK